jgi:hypothetical protein
VAAKTGHLGQLGAGTKKKKPLDCLRDDTVQDLKSWRNKIGQIPLFFLLFGLARLYLRFAFARVTASKIARR